MIRKLEKAHKIELELRQYMERNYLIIKLRK